MPWEETKDYIRSGHESTEDFDHRSFRTINIDESKGIKAIVACRKGHYDESKCEVGTHVISYLFAKDKGWTISEAQVWFDKARR
jgi:hypothetical protein